MHHTETLKKKHKKIWIIVVFILSILLDLYVFPKSPYYFKTKPETESASYIVIVKMLGGKQRTVANLIGERCGYPNPTSLSNDQFFISNLGALIVSLYPKTKATHFSIWEPLTMYAGFDDGPD